MYMNFQEKCFSCYILFIVWLPLLFEILGNIRSSRPEVFLRKGALKICSKFTGEHPCRSALSKKLLCFCNMCIEIACFPGCVVINFEINLIFLIKPFFYMTKKSRQNLNISWDRKELLREKAFFIIFKGLLLVRNCT